MPDVSSLRREIKSWERQFNSSHGRDPSVQDIKDQPAIAEKYKLYKKLSKAAAAAAAETQPHPPSTPQKRDTRPLLLLSRPRVIESPAPLSIYNPFSPAKSKAKQKDSSSRSNIFASPSKFGKNAYPKLVDSTQPSPDVLPAILSFQPIASGSAQLHSPGENAVSRARKRLRGEPVSPSPNKEKRRRVGSSQTLLPFAKLGASALASDDDGGNDDDDDMDDAGEANSSFVDDSPVKAPAGGKSFKLLFEESVPNKNGASMRKRSLSRSNTTLTSVGLFGDRIERAGTLIKEDTDQDLGTIPKDGVKGDLPKNGTAATFASRSLPEKDDLFSGNDAPPYNDIQKPGAQLCQSLLESQAGKSRKRSLSDDEAESARNNTQSQQVTAPKLLPPSPPPVNHSSRGSSSIFREKGKTAAGNRKKAKVHKGSDEEEEEDESANEGKVKLVGWKGYKPSADDPDFDFDSDPILGHDLHRGSRDPLPATASPGSKTGNFEVDLPDKLRRVLAISPSSKSHESKEERVVRGLLSGRRAMSYDAAKGGEIWDAGEEKDEVRGDTDDEDDWEGEGVPWEVGEL